MYVAQLFCPYCDVEVNPMDDSNTPISEPHADWCHIVAYWDADMGRKEADIRLAERQRVSQENYEKLTPEERGRQSLISRLVSVRTYPFGEVRGDEYLTEGQKKLLKERGCL